jgi:transcription elongation factor Elf1
MAAAHTIQCPQCGKDIEIPTSAGQYGRVINIVPPSSIISCPSCGYNLRTEIKGSSLSVDFQWYPLVLIGIGAVLGLFVGSLLWKH